jgi:hypothetical protein
MYVHNAHRKYRAPLPLEDGGVEADEPEIPPPPYNYETI